MKYYSFRKKQLNSVQSVHALTCYQYVPEDTVLLWYIAYAQYWCSSLSCSLYLVVFLVLAFGVDRWSSPVVLFPLSSPCWWPCFDFRIVPGRSEFGEFAKKSIAQSQLFQLIWTFVKRYCKSKLAFVSIRPAVHGEQCTILICSVSPGKLLYHDIVGRMKLADWGTITVS